MKVAVFGLGFVGLTTALGFAEKGFCVRGYDINGERCAAIAGGTVPFFEPGLDEALAHNLGKTFTVAASAAEAAAGSDICFFCVGTPGLADGSADITHLLAAMDSAVGAVAPACVFVVKSTVPPGTLKERVAPYMRGKGWAYPLASNPEFLREGMCWEDFMHPDRVVCGVLDDGAKTALVKLYAPFEAPIHFVAPNTAEFIKYLSNSLLATLISYSNEMALVADAIGDIEIAKAFHILHQDKRLANAGINTYIYPGCGYGGYCLPKDTAALQAAAQHKGMVPRMLESGIALNREMPQLTAKKIIRAAGDKSAKIGILGLAFKPGSDDVRDSSAAKIIAALIDEGYGNIYAYDPLAAQEFERLYGLPVHYCKTAQEMCEVCGTIALVTAWKDFAGIDKEYPQKRFVDCRYFLEG